MGAGCDQMDCVRRAGSEKEKVMDVRRADSVEGLDVRRADSERT